MTIIIQMDVICRLLAYTKQQARITLILLHLGIMQNVHMEQKRSAAHKFFFRIEIPTNYVRHKLKLPRSMMMIHD